MLRHRCCTKQLALSRRHSQHWPLVPFGLASLYSGSGPDPWTKKSEQKSTIFIQYVGYRIWIRNNYSESRSAKKFLIQIPQYCFNSYRTVKQGNNRRKGPMQIATRYLPLHNNNSKTYKIQLIAKLTFGHCGLSAHLQATFPDSMIAWHARKNVSIGFFGTFKGNLRLGNLSGWGDIWSKNMEQLP